MMDCDDVGSGPMDISVLERWVARPSEWDSLSFNRSPYYDVWALSIEPYLFSCYHFKHVYAPEMHQYITDRLSRCGPGELVSCSSAFNGFAIYKTSLFSDCTYYGELKFDFVPMQRIVRQFGPVSYERFPHEDCEHRRFHFEAIHRHGARIRISPECLFLESEAETAQHSADGYLDGLPVHAAAAQPSRSQQQQQQQPTRHAQTHAQTHAHTHPHLFPPNPAPSADSPRAWTWTPPEPEARRVFTKMMTT
jgi:hypothetical protein